MRDGLLTIVLFLALVGCERSNINSVGDSEALFEAIKAKDVATVKSIVESRTVDLDPPRLPNQNNKALVYASAYGNLEIVEIILKEGVDINGQGAYGDVAMIKAAEHGNQDIIDHLISSGADVNQPNVFGVTPFIGFCGGDDVDLVRRCIEKGGKINDSFIQQTGAGKGQRNNTALQTAVSFGRIEIVRLLIANGGDPMLRDGGGSTCVELARQKNFPDVVELLESTQQSVPPKSDRAGG